MGARRTTAGMPARALMAAVLGLLLAAAPASAAAKKPAPAKPAPRKPVVTTTTTVKKATTTTVAPKATAAPTTTAAKLAADLFARTNQERAGRGIGPLTWDPTLAGLAEEWSLRLSTSRFEHRDLKAALDRRELEAFGSIGENIAKMPRRPNMGLELHQAWMHSEGHRANLLQPAWDSIGIGVFCDARGNAWATQNFGRRSDSLLPGPITGTPPVNPIVATSLDGISC